jgi:hypothetical protein
MGQLLHGSATRHLPRRSMIAVNSRATRRPAIQIYFVFLRADTGTAGFVALVAVSRVSTARAP